MLRTVQQLREDSRHIFMAGVTAVDPVAAVQRTVVRRGDTLDVDGVSYDLQRYAHVYVVGAGKAGATMAQGLEGVLGERLTGGVVTVKYGHLAPVSRVTIYEAAHPVPDEAGVRGAEALIRLAQQAGADDLIFCLLSGGGSALLPAPSPGITLEEKQRVTSLFLECGASIDEINVIRKHISRLKGGQLARVVAPATLIPCVLPLIVLPVIVSLDPPITVSAEPPAELPTIWIVWRPVWSVTVKVPARSCSTELSVAPWTVLPAAACTAPPTNMLAS